MDGESSAMRLRPRADPGESATFGIGDSDDESKLTVVPECLRIMVQVCAGLRPENDSS